MKKQIATILCAGSLPLVISYYAASWHQLNYSCGSPPGSFAEFVGRVGMPVARLQANLARSRYEAAVRSLQGEFESILKDGRAIQFSVETASGTALISAINEYPAVKPSAYRLSYYEPDDEELVLILDDGNAFFEAIQRNDGTLDLRYDVHTGKPITVTFTRIPSKQGS